MDAICCGSSLLIQQLKLPFHVPYVKTSLLTLFGSSLGHDPVDGLLEKFKFNRSLVPMLGSWIGDGPNIPFSKESVYRIFGEDAIERFAQELLIDTQLAVEILSRTIPTIVSCAKK